MGCRWSILAMFDKMKGTHIVDAVRLDQEPSRTLRADEEDRVIRSTPQKPQGLRNSKRLQQTCTKQACKGREMVPRIVSSSGKVCGGKVFLPCC